MDVEFPDLPRPAVAGVVPEQNEVALQLPNVDRLGTRRRQGGRGGIAVHWQHPRILLLAAVALPHPRVAVTERENVAVVRQRPEQLGFHDLLPLDQAALGRGALPLEKGQRADGGVGAASACARRRLHAPPEAARHVHDPAERRVGRKRHQYPLTPLFIAHRARVLLLVVRIDRTRRGRRRSWCGNPCSNLLGGEPGRYRGEGTRRIAAHEGQARLHQLSSDGSARSCPNSRSSQSSGRSSSSWSSNEGSSAGIAAAAASTSAGRSCRFRDVSR